jgi:NADPH2:quinone reductase
MAAGLYQLKPPLPFTPGVEGAGIVIEVADGVTAPRVGDKVVTHQRFGGYADEAVLDAARVTSLPQGFSFEEGAAFTVASTTSYHALATRAALRTSEVLLVHGAGGGVGLAAVEIGKLLGATVIATASSEAKLAAARAKGANHAIDYERLDFREEVMRLTDGKGADVVYDPVGGAVFEQSVRSLAWGGRLLIIGFAGGTIPAVQANRVLLKGASIIGVRAGEAARRDPALRQHEQAALLRFAESGHLRPHISHVLPLERFAVAMRLLTERKAIGRVVLSTGLAL